eukprot:Amastigsp_a176283_338.p1 type:complete len:153 gc:universal Amastigsp_a176283_338:32-490(+)
MSAAEIDPESREEFQMAFQEVAKAAPVLNMAGLGTVLRNMGQLVSATELNEMCAAANVNPNAIDFNSFLNIMTKKVKAVDSKEDIIEAFSVFDKDGSGYISASELRHVLTNLGDRLAEVEVNSMLSEADTGADGRINYQSFVALMLEKGDHL